MHKFTVEAANQITQITTWGTEDKPTLLCLHGLGGTALSFIEIAEALSDSFYIVAPTIPGSGGTEEFPTAEHYLIPTLVEWLKSTLDALNIEQCFMLSHSWGAHMGLFFQNKYPARVSKQILLDGGYYLREAPNNTLAVLEQEIAEQITSDNDYCFDNEQDYLKAEEGDVNHWNEQLASAAMDRAVSKDGKLHWHLSSQFTDWSFRGIFASPPTLIYDELKSKNLNDKLVLFRATLPVSYTERDHYEREFNEQTGLQVTRIEGAGHSIHLDKPDVVIEKAREYFI